MYVHIYIAIILCVHTSVASITNYVIHNIPVCIHIMRSVIFQPRMISFQAIIRIVGLYLQLQMIVMMAVFYKHLEPSFY